MRWQAYRRVTHSTCSRVGMSPPLPGGRKWTWLRPPRQKWGLGQPFRGRREAPGTPSGLESPVEGRGGEDEGGGGGRIGGGEEGSWVGQLVRKEGWRKDIRLEEKPGRSSPPRVPPPLEALPPWTTLGIRGGEGTGRVRGMEGEEVGGVGGVGVGVGTVGGVRGVEGDISSELYGDWLWDENFKFCLIFTHFSRFSPFSGYIWWNNTLSSLENFSLNSILFFLFLMSHPDNGGFLKIAQKRDSISKKTSFCIMVINTDHQESWFLSVGHPLCALR